MIGTACKLLTCRNFFETAKRTIAEHHTLYEYNLVGAKNHYIGLAQTETVNQSKAYV